MCGGVVSKWTRLAFSRGSGFAFSAGAALRSDGQDTEGIIKSKRNVIQTN